MRINVYSQELTNEVGLISKTSNTGFVYSAVQLMLHSSPMLHHPGPVEANCPDCDGKGQFSVDMMGTAFDDCVTCDATGKITIENDDDRSAVTLWLPKSPDRREDFAKALEEMAALVRSAPAETGLD